MAGYALLRLPTMDGCGIFFGVMQLPRICQLEEWLGSYRRLVQQNHMLAVTGHACTKGMRLIV